MSPRKKTQTLHPPSYLLPHKHKDMPSYLPEEVIVNILLRLPTRYVLRCRCVCKLWRALVSQPKFTITHLNRTKHLQEQQTLFYYRNFPSLYAITLSNDLLFHDETSLLAKRLNFPGRFAHLNWDGIYGSYDGLILASDMDAIYYLLNPATQEIRKVPSSPSVGNRNLITCRNGFGYDSVTDDYKILSFSYYDDDYLQHDDDAIVSIFSVTNYTWKKVGNCPFGPDDRLYNPFVFLNGFFHLLARKLSNADYVSVISAFDLAQEKFCHVPFPTLLEFKDLMNYNLIVLGGCLCLYSIIDDPETRYDEPLDIKIDVWVMKEYGVQNSWTKVFTIIHPDRAWITPVCLLGREQVILEKDMPGVAPRLVIYSIEEGTSKDIVVHHPDIRAFGACSPFLESLISPYCNYNSYKGKLS